MMFSTSQPKATPLGDEEKNKPTLKSTLLAYCSLSSRIKGDFLEVVYIKIL